MKIALAGTYAGRGGIQTHLHWLARALLESGHDVLLISLGAALRPDDLGRADSLRDAGSLTLFDGASNPLSSLSTAKRCLKRLRSFRPDLYLACGTGWNLFLPAILSSRCPRRVFHEVMSGEAGGWRDSRWAVRCGFHEVFAQASPVARNFQQSFGWKKEVPVLPAFPEPLELTATLPDCDGPRPRNGKTRAAFFSRLVPHKQGLWLVQQWPRLSASLSELHLFGTGPEEPAIRELIASRGWSREVFCQGAYPGGQAYVDLLTTFDLTLLPTLGAEGAPLVLLESMACGVPFVATDAGGIRDYENPDCLIVPMDFPEAFLFGVESMAARIENGSINRRGLRQHYLDHYSYEALSRAWRGWVETAQPSEGFSPDTDRKRTPVREDIS